MAKFVVTGRGTGAITVSCTGCRARFVVSEPRSGEQGARLKRVLVAARLAHTCQPVEVQTALPVAV